MRYLSKSYSIFSSRITVETGLVHAFQLISTQPVKGSPPWSTPSRLHEQQRVYVLLQSVSWKETGSRVFRPCLRKLACLNVCACRCQNNGSTLVSSYLKTLSVDPPRVRTLDLPTRQTGAYPVKLTGRRSGKLSPS